MVSKLSETSLLINILLDLDPNLGLYLKPELWDRNLSVKKKSIILIKSFEMCGGNAESSGITQMSASRLEWSFKKVSKDFNILLINCPPPPPLPSGRRRI